MRALKAKGRVVIEIEKRLPVQGGLGGASANAVAALLGLERVLKKALPAEERLRIAAEVGSDLPLFLIGGTVLGVGRGEQVYPLEDLPATRLRGGDSGGGGFDAEGVCGVGSQEGSELAAGGGRRPRFARPDSRGGCPHIDRAGGIR